MSVKSSNSIGETLGEVVKSGYLKKLKTMRKKYFVLRAETLETSAKLEYYDSEKKYRSQQPPKRSISLKACFNINKRVDTKHKHVIALYTKDDCFCIVLDNDRELEEWLKSLLSLQHGEDMVDGEPIKPTFEHVWQVTMLNKGLGSSRNILGAYHLCFTDKTLSLVRKTTGIPPCGIPTDHVEFSLMSVRRCGHSECFFYMEVGRSAVTGAGELWMQTEDTNIAQNMGEVILRAMSNNNNKEDLGPKPRIRSSSANEASKPILVQRRQTHSGQKSTSYCSPSQDGDTAVPAAAPVPEAAQSTSGYANICTSVAPQTQNVTGMGGGRERCDSMPSRCRTASEGNPYTPTPASTSCHFVPGSTPPVAVVHPMHRPHHMHQHLAPHHRPQSLYAREAGRDISHSPPVGGGMAGSPVSPASGVCSAACSTDSAGSSLSIDEANDGWNEYVETNISRYGHSLTPDEPIAEENPDEGTDNCYVAVSPTSGTPPLNGGYVPMAPLSSDDGYVDMSPRGRHDMSPAASTCSITSGTPSTDLRFSEYHLEKVSSYFTPSEEDDTSSAERPIRAYSVGSRPDILKLRTKHGDLNPNDHNNRVRAFSVGSRSKGIHSRVLPPHHHNHTGVKSSSAPLLSGSNSHLGSQSSMERMEDLMELDFSRKLPQKAGQPETGYVDMSSPRSRTVSGSTPSAPSGYLEMRPGISDCTVGSPAAVSPCKPEETREDHPYMDMRPNMATSTSGQSQNQTSPYLEMKPGTSPNKYSPYYMEMSGPSKFSSSPKNNQNIPKTTSPIQEEYLEMDFKQTKSNRTLSGAARTQPVDLPHPKKTNEGYMDMSWSRHQRKSSLDSAKVNINNNNNNDDYMNMTGNARKKERKGSKKDKARSQPIMIQQPVSTTTTSTKSSQSPVSSFANFLQNRNAPPNYLPLQSCSYSPSSSPFSSLRRPRSRKNSRRDSKDSTSGLVTPTNSDSTIFPFSPGSPIKPFNVKTPEAPNRKCPVDASSGTVKISGKPPSGGDYQKMSLDKNSDYTEMNFEPAVAETKKEDTDYVNYNPCGSRQRNSSNHSDDYGEYAIMRPIQIVPIRKISAPVVANPNLTKQLAGLSVKPCVFRPIVEPQDTRLGAVSPKIGDVAPHRSFENLQSEEKANYETLRTENKLPRPQSVTDKPENSPKNHLGSSVGSLTSLTSEKSESKSSLSRPSSVSSELGSTSSTLVGDSRPGSVCSDQRTELHYASLDLAPVEDEASTKSPRSGRMQETRSPTPNSGSSDTGFTYAEIDFIKSESFKNQKMH